MAEKIVRFIDDPDDALQLQGKEPSEQPESDESYEASQALFDAARNRAKSSQPSPYSGDSRGHKKMPRS